MPSEYRPRVFADGPPSESWAVSPQDDRISLHRYRSGLERFGCRAVGDRPVEVKFASVARAVDQPGGDRVQCAARVGAFRREPLDLTGGRLGEHDVAHDDT